MQIIKEVHPQKAQQTDKHVNTFHMLFHEEFQMQIKCHIAQILGVD